MRSSVPTFPGSATRHSASPRRLLAGDRQIGATEDGEHARRVRECRDLREQLRLDVLAGDEPVDRLRAGGEPGLDEILSLAHEQPEPLALPARLQPADQLQARVRRRT